MSGVSLKPIRPKRADNAGRIQTVQVLHWIEYGHIPQREGAAKQGKRREYPPNLPKMTIRRRR
jgi:hypothetical protein